MRGRGGSANFAAMSGYRTILGGIVAFFIGTAAWADWPVGGPLTQTRPLSRSNAADLAAQAERALLSSVRPVARPMAMVRYPVTISANPTLRPVARTFVIPDARWDHRAGSDQWTLAALAALRTHGSRLDDTVPRDIATWCPAYANNPAPLRRAFWVGMLSALAKHESTYRPAAVGGGDLWYGLLQIYPDTARRYGCRATTGEALKNPEDNLSCAVRIMNVTVPRDGAIAVHDGRWRGVAADWGPMADSAKIAEMAAWTRAQDYCQPTSAVATAIRPQARPAQGMTSGMALGMTLSTMNDS